MIGSGAVYAQLGTGVIDGAAWGFTDGSTGTGGRSLGPQLDAPPWVSGVLGTAMATAGAVVAWGAVHEARARAGGAAARPVRARSVAVAALMVTLSSAYRWKSAR